MTSLAEEQDAQARWTARLRRPIAGYDVLVSNEFLSEGERRAQIASDLAQVLNFSVRHVPYYRDLFESRGVDAASPDPSATLGQLPVLSKLDLIENEERLLAKVLPPGDAPKLWTHSSGTTGRPAKVLHSRLGNWMFTYLRQRALRWFRFDPAGKFAEMRLPSHLQPKPDGGELGSNETLRLAGWPYVGEHFATGPYVAYSVLNDLDDRIAWLTRENPDYLLAYSETLEQLAFAAGANPPASNLKGSFGIAELVTPGMHAHIERGLRAPLHQNYGLNEIGLVAARCEAGRYHVHTEHCLVEIVDDDGRPVTAGESGRLVVTALKNPAMPLLRYDTGDIAVATSGDCACGRTMPAFEDIIGRYSRIRFLPEGTLGLAGALRTAIEEMPLDAIVGLREFQIHQFRDGRFELRVIWRGSLAAAFEAVVRQAWLKAAGPSGPALGIVRVEQLPPSRGGKIQVFTSDFMPAT